jgi:hypothetical protein
MYSVITRTSPAVPLTPDLDRVIARVPGAISREGLFALTLLAQTQAGDGHFVVVGAGQGRAAIALGLVARAMGRGRVFAIDVFPEANEGPDGADWSLENLLTRVADHELDEWVLPHHGTAASFARLMPAQFRCRFIHVEDAHACTNVETDLFVLEPHLAAGGWLTVDRTFESFPGAADAIDVLLRQRAHFDLTLRPTADLFVARKRAEVGRRGRSPGSPSRWSTSAASPDLATI